MTSFIRPLPALPEDPPAGPLDQHRVERGLDPRELGGHVLAEPAALAEVLGVDPPDRPLGLGDQGVELVVAPDVERPEPVEELGQVADGRVAEDPGLAVLADARDPLGQVGDEPGELVEERLLGELDGLLEPGRDPRPLGLVQPRRELHEVIGRLDRGEPPLDPEEADEGLGVIGRVEQRAEPLAGGLLEFGVVPVEVGHGVVQLGAEVGHLGGERLDDVVPDQPDARLGVRQREPLPVGVDLAADRRDGAEGRVTGVDQLLAGGEVLALGPERLGGAGLLLGVEGLLGAHPGERDPGGGHGRAEPLGRGDRGIGDR